jgi:hypothetical protein
MTPEPKTGTEAAPARGLSFGQPEQPEPARVRSALFLVGTGYLFLTLCDYREGIANLALRYLLKDEMHLTAAQLAAFFAVTKLAWYCKPFAGLLTDNVRLFGTRRKGYLVTFSLVAAGLWFALAFAPGSYAAMLWLVVAINFALMITHTTLGGILVESGQALRATGRISAVRSGSESFGWLVTGLVAGWIAIHLREYGFLLNGLLMIALAAIFIRLIREPREEPAASGASRKTAVDFKGLLRHRTLWMAAGFWVLIKFSPSFGTPLFYHQSETLRFTPQMIGYLGFVSAAAGLLGSLCYMRLCRQIALIKLLWFGIALNAVAALAYFGYRSAGAALVIEAAYGLSTALAFMPIFDLLARATPKNFAAFGYALIFSFGSLSVSGSDVVGSWIYEHLGRSFAAMILLDSGTSALVLLAIPLLPRILVTGRDGENPSPS